MSNVEEELKKTEGSVSSYMAYKLVADLFLDLKIPMLEFEEKVLKVKKFMLLARLEGRKEVLDTVQNTLFDVGMNSLDIGTVLDDINEVNNV